MADADFRVARYFAYLIDFSIKVRVKSSYNVREKHNRAVEGLADEHDTG